jgi:hypothetical protein
MSIRSALHRTNRSLWWLTGKIPFLKRLLLILNSYVWMGRPEALLQFAPIGLYIRRFLAKLSLIVVSAWALLKYGPQSGVIRADAMNLVDIALSLFPNVLGFGIGAYALLFTFPERFFPRLEERREAKNLQVGAHGLNAITAYPLLAIALIILGCACSKILVLSPRTSDTIGLAGILYGMLMTMEVIAVLFVSARKVIRNSL